MGPQSGLVGRDCPRFSDAQAWQNFVSQGNHPDAVLVTLGTNDATIVSGLIKQGQLNISGKIRESIEFLAESILGKFPNSLVFLLEPLGLRNSDALAIICNAVGETSVSSGTIRVVSHKACGLTYKDRAHLTAAAHKVLARLLATEIGKAIPSM